MKFKKDIIDGYETLIYLKNKKGGWGELKTQESRLTNTCEAIWALKVINYKRLSLKSSINLILKGVRKENEYKSQNCEVPRDYAWALIALTSCKTPIKAEELKTCFYEIKSKYKDTIGGYGSRSKPNKYNSFYTAIIIIGLIKLYIYVKNKSISYEHEVLDLISKLIQNAEDSRSGLAWGLNKNEKPEIGYTSYMLYAFALYHNNILKKSRVIDDALIFVENNKNWKFSCEMDSRPDNRPYRHFSMAWILLFYQEFEFKEYSLKILKDIIDLKLNCERGWAYPKDIMPSTWATSLASLAIHLFTSKYGLIDLLKEKKLINDKTKVDINSEIKLNNNIFIVHGHDLKALDYLKTVLREDFSLNPIVAKDMPSTGMRVLLEKFENYAKQCDTVIALFSDDDNIKNDNQKYIQPRPNAIFELGWFIAKLPKERIIVIKQKDTTLFSDLSGVVCIEYEKNINDCYRELQKELKSIIL